MLTTASKKIKTFSGEQIAGTPSENIKQFEIEDCTVRAIFLNEARAEEYLNKYATDCSDTRSFTLNNCIFTIKGKVIEATSSTNSPDRLLLMLLNGLR